MNENKVPGIWKWTVILLIACNMALVLTLWLKPQAGGGGHGEDRGHRGPRDYIIAQLKLTSEQVKRYDELIKVHHSSMEQLRKESVGLRRLLFDNIKNTPAFNADSVAKLIAKTQEQIELITYLHFAQVRTDICTDAQKAELDRIINDVMRQMNGALRGMPPPDAQDGHEPPPPGSEDGAPGQPEGHRPPPEDR